MDAGAAQPWHLTSLHQGAERLVDSDAKVSDRGLGVNASGDDRGSYRLVQRYGEGDTGLRANHGQVILAKAAPDTTGGIAKAFSAIPARNAMDVDNDEAALYRWTDPANRRGGDAGQIKPALRSISGYVWCDNSYNDGAYTWKTGKYYDELLKADRDLTAAAERGYAGDIGLDVYLRQWYFDGTAWQPVLNYSSNYNETDPAKPFAFDSFTTVAAGDCEGRAKQNGYFEFTGLPASVYVDGKEYLAGYTLAVKGDSTLLPTFFQVETSNDPTLHESDTPVDDKGRPTSPIDFTKMDQWNSKSHGRLVGDAATAADVARYGASVFPVYRDNSGSHFNHVANCNDGDIHTLDTVLVLAGSATVDKSESGKVAPSQYGMSTTGGGVNLSFDFTFGKNEGRMNAGFTEPPNAPISGYVWQDRDYNGIRDQKISVDAAGKQTLERGSEPGYKDVWIRAEKYFLDKDGTWKLVPGQEVERAKTDANGFYKFPRMRTSYDVTTVVEGKEVTTYYLAAYRLYVEGLPAGTTLSRPHNAGTIAGTTIASPTVNGVESDIYRASVDGAKDFPLVHRVNEEKNDGADKGKTLTRADGLVITARPLPDAKVDEASLKAYDGIIYDVSGGVNMAYGGDAGLVEIPSTSIKGLVWDDTYRATGNAFTDAQRLENAYNGQQDVGEEGIAGVTLKATQWAYDADNMNWKRVSAFGESGVLSTITKNGSAADASTLDKTDKGIYEFEGLPSAVREGVSHGTNLEKDVTTAGLGDASISALYDDNYLLTSYEVEVDGLQSGSDDGARRLTRYHVGVPTDDPANDSDVATMDRTGAAKGRVVSDQATIAGVVGTRVGGAYADAAVATKGSRIVVAAEGVESTEENRTKLADSADWRTVPMSQLLDVAEPDAAKQVGFDWLTVPSKVTYLGEPDIFEDGGTIDWVRELIPAQGGNIGLVEPTRQSIRGFMWNDKNNDGVQSAGEQPYNGYQVDLDRYWFNEKSGTWQLDDGFKYESTWSSKGDLVSCGNVKYGKDKNEADVVTVGAPSPDDRTIAGTLTRSMCIDDGVKLPLEAKALGEYNLGNELWRSGTYSFDNLETAGVREGNWVLYGYKVRVTDPRVTSGSYLKAKQRVKADEDGNVIDYTQDSDLYADNALVGADDEMIVLADVVDVNSMTTDGRLTAKANIAWAPATSNADVAATLTDTGRTQMKKNATDAASLVAYDYMTGRDRAHNDGGLIVVPTYKISGFVFSDEDYDGLYEYLPETRTEVTYDANGNEKEKDVTYGPEAGYNGKKVLLQKWYYEPGKNGAAGTWVKDGVAEDLTKTYKNYGYQLIKTDSDAGKHAVLDDHGNIQTESRTADVDGYFEFAGLPTAVPVDASKPVSDSTRRVSIMLDNNGEPMMPADGTGEYAWRMAGYTLEVDGSNSATGLVSLLVTSYEWDTTPADAVNSNAAPMLTEDSRYKIEKNPDGSVKSKTPIEKWMGYTEGNYPILMDRISEGSDKTVAYDETNIQTGSAHHTAQLEEGDRLFDPSAAVTVNTEGGLNKLNDENNAKLYNPAQSIKYVSDGVGGKDSFHGAVLMNGISKNAMDGKIVLAGIGTNKTHEAQRLTRTVGGTTLDFDFALGQDQSAMNAGPCQPQGLGLVRRGLRRRHERRPSA